MVATTARSNEKPQDDGLGDETVRVHISLLERLMASVSELVQARNQLLQMARGRDDCDFAAPIQSLSRITTDLQDGVMKTRMQPIGIAWKGIPKLVSDLAATTGKHIEVRTVGADTELDRQILETIKDMMANMVRNAAAHGLETRDKRLQAGKPEVGHIVLSACNEGGHVIIEVEDDGRGLDAEHIRQRAAAVDIASEADLAAMAPQQLYQLVFRPGFSSDDTDGYGMDAIKANVERIGGTVDLRSTPGHGTSVVLKIPLTLAIVPALIVEVAGERFALPQINVLELVRTQKGSAHQLEHVNGTPMLRLRDRILPLVSLRRILSLGEDGGEDCFVVVIQVGNKTFGVIVDRVFDTEEIVVKANAPMLRHLRVFSGNTILGDGSVVMILDPSGVVTAAGDSSHADGVDAHGVGTLAATAATRSEAVATQALLVFRAGGTELSAVPLGLVARLEDIAAADVEHVTGRTVVQYRGALMPLVGFDGAIPFADGLTTHPVLVFADRDLSLGIVVDEIIDIVEDNVKVELVGDRPGVVGTAVVGGRATTLIDVGHYLAAAHGAWFSTPSSSGGKRSLLLVDDSNFFRSVFTPLLQAAGYLVTAVASAEAALALRDEGAMFDAIVSDIEMPGMGGFDLALAIRSDVRWADIPLVALTSLGDEPAKARGQSTGFDAWVTKTERVAVAEAVDRLVQAKQERAA